MNFCVDLTFVYNMKKFVQIYSTKLFFVVVGLCLTVVFHLSEAENNIFILTHPKLRELYSNTGYFDNQRNSSNMQRVSEWKYTATHRKKNDTNLCEKVNMAHIIVASRPLHKPENDNEFIEASNYFESHFLLNESSLSKTNEKVYEYEVSFAKLLFNNEIIQTRAIFCQFGESQKKEIYLARQKEKSYYFLFGRTDDTEKFPKLLAVVANYLQVKRHTPRRNHFKNLLRHYKNQNTDFDELIMVKKLFFDDDIEIFRMWASLLVYESKNYRKQKYIISIPGPDHNLKTLFPLNMIPEKKFKNTAASLPALVCQIKNITDPNVSLNLEYYIIPHLHYPRLNSQSAISVVHISPEHSNYYKTEIFCLPTSWTKKFNSSSLSKVN